MFIIVGGPGQETGQFWSGLSWTRDVDRAETFDPDTVADVVVLLHAHGDTAQPVDAPKV